jgi:hypothetical protein
MNRSWLALVGPAAAACVSAAGCSADHLDFTKAPVQTVQTKALTLTSLDQCPTLDPSTTAVGPDGSVVIEKACVEDEEGRFYAIPFSDTAAGVLVVPTGHTYSFVYEFGNEWVPTAAAAASAGAASAVVSTPPPPCALSVVDYDGGNATVTACGGPVTETPVASTLAVRGDLLVHTVTAPPPPGLLVSSSLDLRVLLPGRGLDIGFSGSFQTGDDADP